jgi:hypothetical protein
MTQLDEVKLAKTAFKASILSKSNVVGVGVGYKVTKNRVTDELSVVVLVRQKVPYAGLPTKSIIPQEVAGIKTDVIEVGDLRPLDIRTDRQRPAPGGVSLGHYKITAGTLGCVVHDRKTGARLILSNNHVLANRNEAQPGDPILQPGPIDGGQADKDTIALLLRFQPINFNTTPPTCNLAKGYASLGNILAKLTGSRHQVQVLRVFPTASNLVDAAVARPIDERDILDESLEIGPVNEETSPELGMAVCKSGRTTGYTTGTICVLDSTVVVNYGSDQPTTFEEQIITTPMSNGGDSGSLLVAKDTSQAVGLLFAGSSQTTVYNPIKSVLSSLNVDLKDRKKPTKSEVQGEIEKAQSVKRVYQDILMSKANVVGVGVGLCHKEGKRTDRVGLIVMVSRKVPKTILAIEDTIPEELDGVPVDVKEVGALEIRSSCRA